MEDLKDMKIYAVQVPPERQTSPLFLEDIPENVYIFGNRHFYERGANEISDIRIALYNAADFLEDLEKYGDDAFYSSFSELAFYEIPAPKNKYEYNAADLEQWRDVLKKDPQDFDTIAAAISIITGREYKAAQLRGCCQREWNNILYPADYGREWLEEFEIEYFNTGAEWHINEGEPYDLGEYFYTHAWDEEGQRAEIAAALGVDPADVVLYVFDGYEQTPKYKEVLR